VKGALHDAVFDIKLDAEPALRRAEQHAADELARHPA